MDNVPAPSPDDGGDSVPQVYYLVHGWFAFVAFGVLFPLAIMIARFGQGRLKQRWGRGAVWFHAHYSLNILGVLFATVSLAVAYRKFGLPLDIAHMRLGVAVGLLVWLQPLLSIFRPKRGCKGRVPWYIVHWLIGMAAVILGVINIQLGLNAYKEFATEKYYPGEKIHKLYAIYFAFIGFAYLFLDLMPYFARQRIDDDASVIIPGTNPNKLDNRTQV